MRHSYYYLIASVAFYNFLMVVVRGESFPLKPGADV